MAFRRKTKDKPKIYVAHTLGIRKWVKENVFPILEKAGFEILDPFENRRNAFENMSEEDIRKMISEMAQTPRWIVTHDLKMIDSSNGVLVVNNGGPSYGSTYEAAYASMVLNLPVAFVAKKNYEKHPWLVFFSIAVSHKVEEAVSMLASWFGMDDFQ